MRSRWPGYRGEITATAKNKYDVVSVVNKINATTVEITELPIHKRTPTCKVELESMIAGKENDAGTTKEYKEHHENVHFVITMDAKQLEKAEEKGLTEFSKIQTSNMICLDFDGKIKKYNSPEEITEDFYPIRLAYYQKRKAATLQDAFEKLTNQARFVKMIVDKELIINSRKKAEIIVDLKRHKSRPFPKISTAKEAGEQEDALEQEEEDAGTSHGNDYDYLLGMAISSLTREKIDKLLQTAADKEQELLALLQISPKEMQVVFFSAFGPRPHSQVLKELEIKKHLDANGKKIKRKQTTLKTRKSIGKHADSDSEDDFRPAPKHKAPKSKRPKPAAKDDDDDNDEPPPPPKKRAPPEKLSKDDDAGSKQRRLKKSQKTMFSPNKFVSKLSDAAKAALEKFKKVVSRGSTQAAVATPTQVPAATSTILPTYRELYHTHSDDVYPLPPYVYVAREDINDYTDTPVYDSDRAVVLQVIAPHPILPFRPLQSSANVLSCYHTGRSTMTRQLATDSPHRLVPSARSPCRMQVYPITHSLSVFVRRRSHRTLQFTAVRVSVTTSCPHQGVKPTGATVTVEWPLAAAGESISVLHLNRHGLWCPLQAGPTVKQSGIRFAETVVRAIGGHRSGSGAVRSPLVLLRPISPPKPETGYGAEEDDLTSQSPETIADRYGQPQIHRQEAIHNLCVTEEVFAARLTNTINIFILPLRMQDSKCYISGVPAEIARLCDWPED
ncbi:DNA topoisomerase [Mycena polygramma]|nr:DNA topoisomerase [Mycena polygramma]